MLKNYWIRKGSVSLINRSTNVFFGLLTFLFLVRVLDKENFGIWVLFYSVTAFLESTRRAFLHNSLVKYLVNEDSIENKKKIATASFFLNFLFFFFIGALLYFFANFLSDLWDAPILNLLLKVYLFKFLLQTSIIWFEGISQANFDFSVKMWGEAVEKILFISMVVSIYIIFGIINLELLIIILVIASLVQTAICFMLSKKYLYGFVSINKHWVTTQFNFGKYTFGTNISSMIFKSIDSWMLGFLVSNKAVAIYNPAIRVSNIFEVPLQALSSVTFPKMANEFKYDSNLLKVTFEKSIGLLLSVILPLTVLVLVFSKQIIILIAGYEYLDAVPILRITMLYGLIVPFNRQFGILMNATGNEKTNFSVILLATVLNIGFNYILIANFGIAGAAYSTFVSYIIVCIVGEYILRRKYNVRILNIFSYSMSFYLKGFYRLRDSLSKI